MWFPVDGERRLKEHPLHIRVEVPASLRPFLNEGSLAASADILGQTLEVVDAVEMPGYSDGVLNVRLVARDEVVDEGGGGLRTANSNEDGTFWVCLPAMERLWDAIGWRFPDLTREAALVNKVTFAVKHELFVHLLGLGVESRRAIFRMDEYSATGFLDSADPQDTFYDRPRELRPDHPYILWRHQW